MHKCKYTNANTSKCPPINACWRCELEPGRRTATPVGFSPQRTVSTTLQGGLLIMLRIQIIYKYTHKKTKMSVLSMSLYGLHGWKSDYIFCSYTSDAICECKDPGKTWCIGWINQQLFCFNSHLQSPISIQSSIILFWFKENAMSTSGLTSTMTRCAETARYTTHTKIQIQIQTQVQIQIHIQKDMESKV